MIKGYKYRVYPNQKQLQKIYKTADACRLVYNTFLDEHIERNKHGDFPFLAMKNKGRLYRMREENPALRDVPYPVLFSSLRNLETECRKNKKKVPKKKSENAGRFSFCYPNLKQTIYVKDGGIYLPDLGRLKTLDERMPEGNISNATVSRTPSGNFFVSLLCSDVPDVFLEKTGQEVTISPDKVRFVTSDKDIPVDEKALAEIKNSERLVGRAEAIRNKKSAGGKNYEKACLALAKAQERAANVKKDFLNKLTTELIRRFDVIYIAKGNGAPKTPLPWTEFERMLNYKAKWYGRTVSVIRI